MTQRGVLYLAFGESNLRQARRSLESLRLTGCTLPVRIVTDRTNSIEGAEVVFKAVDPVPYSSRFWKTWMNHLTPWDETLFLDSDTLISNPIDPVWDFLADADMGMARDAYWCISDLRRLRHTFYQEKRYTVALMPPPYESEYHNSGVMVWKKNETTDKLFEDWHQDWQRFKQIDQLALARTIFRMRTTVSLVTLPQTFNCRGFKYVNLAEAREAGEVILHFCLPLKGEMQLAFPLSPA
jgi:lipopolysaccharide biosynthesis glycosyltransferase